jgi:hypothetical protein
MKLILYFKKRPAIGRFSFLKEFAKIKDVK